MNNFKRNFYILLLMSFLACMSLGWYAYHETLENSHKSLQITALTDTVTLYKTKSGKNGAYVPVFQGTKSEILAAVKIKELRIAKAIKSTPGIKSFTEIKTVTKTDTTVRIDTIRLPINEKPLFLVKDIKTEFYQEKITVNGDSLTISRQNFESFDFITKDKSNGFLKPKTYVTDVVAKNPDTKIVGLKSFEITPKTHTGLKISIGVAAGVAAVLLLK